MKIIPFLSALLFLLIGCKNPPDISSQREEVTEVEQFLLNYYSTMSARNWEAYREYFWDGATISTTWRDTGDTLDFVKIYSIDDFIEQTPEGPDSQPIFEEKMLSSEIEIRKNLAQAWVKYEAKFGTEENLMEWEGTDLFSLMKLRGEWKIVALVFSAE